MLLSNLPRTFISIAIVGTNLPVITNVVEPVGIMLKRPVCYVGVDLRLVDTPFADKRAG